MCILVCACARSTKFEVSRRLAMSDNRNSTVSAFISRVPIIHKWGGALEYWIVAGLGNKVYVFILTFLLSHFFWLSLCTEEEEKDRICPGHKTIYLRLGPMSLS